MARGRSKRLDRVERAVATLPLRQDVVQKAFEEFRESGDLPEQQRLAAEVVQQALRGGKTPEHFADTTSLAERIRRLLTVAEERAGGEPPKPQRPPVREYLFGEAVYATGIVQYAARTALKAFVGIAGADPTDPEFLANQTLPDHAGLGLHLLGFPQRLAKPPYVKQAHRLFARYADLRDRINHDDPEWFQPFEAAIVAIEETGQLPDDELVRDAVLADLELKALFEHAGGHDVQELMALLDQAARAKGRAREAAIARVQEFLRTGRLPDQGG